ncbi:hypothetical protein [Sphingomonas turrisvirgatae]|uniref:Uncharacterized protein n=1 Tax=Sphingomonas turrisvirgatae TaxID=1888892 RepID=A0A1E3LTQ2_9SPHN|nr:hypothetical protein [Sphingomonas turrisvirgatae]ODP36200.1 hypothetical protein BFL28_07265 [Sphingomonas turrisvirgatae]
MATGYDRRQASRDTFAFKPAAAGQQQARASGQSRGAQLVGGQSVGEGVAAGPQTDAGPVAAGLGQFVKQIMEPHIQRRQQEEFFKGYTRAQEGVALEEITTSSKGLNKVFGPTAYEQGARVFTAQGAIATWQQGRMAEMDQLKRLPPDELAKVLATTSQEIMTGDPFADQILQKDLIEAGGPLTALVAKERYTFLQSEAARTYGELGSKAGTSLQQIATANARLTAPDDATTTALAQQTQVFLGTMVKPEGMDDETYRKFLYNFMAGAMERGDFYAVSALRRAGITAVFGDDEKLKLENAYERYGNRVLGKAVMQPEFADRLLKLDTRMKMAEIQTEGGITPIEAAQELASINAELKRATGIEDIDLFDMEDIRGAAGDVVKATVSAFKRAQDRQWQIADRNQQRQWDLEDQAREDAQETAQVGAMWAAGAVNSGIAAGMKAGDFDVLAINDYRAGNFKNIANAYAREGWVSGRTGSMMRARITSSLGQQYTKEFKAGHDEWAALYKANPAAAKAYYGNLHLPMQRFDQLVKGGTSPQIAFVRSFGDPAVYSKDRVPPERRKGVQEAAEKAIADTQPYTLFGYGITGTPLNESSKRALVNAVRENAGVAVSAAPGLSDDAAVRQEFKALTQSGRAEVYGAWAWTGNPAGTTPLWRMLGVKQGEAEKIIDSAIAGALRASGSNPTDGIVTRIQDTQTGKPALVVQGTADGEDRIVVIPYSKLATAARARVEGEVRGNQRKRRVTNPNPYIPMN